MVQAEFIVTFDPIVFCSCLVPYFLEKQFIRPLSICSAWMLACLMTLTVLIEFSLIGGNDERIPCITWVSTCENEISHHTGKAGLKALTLKTIGVNMNWNLHLMKWISFMK